MSFNPTGRPQSAKEILERLGLREKVVFGFKLVRQLPARSNAWQTTWEAVSESGQRKVALTIYSAELSKKADFTVALQQAVQRARQLRPHPRVAQIYDYHYESSGPDGAKAAVSAEFCEGKSMAELLSEATPFTEEKVIGPYINQLCDAMSVAHDQGLAHQDIRPANLIISEDGLKVINFGLSDCLNITVPEAAGVARQPDGKMAFAEGSSLKFMSPQRSRFFYDTTLQGKPSDAPTDDIYSIGATIYYLLTGTAPFSDEQILSQALRYEAMKGRRHHHWGRTRTATAEEIPASWERAVERALKPQPPQRPKTTELTAILSGAPGGGKEPFFQRTPVKLAAALAVVAVLVMAGLYAKRYIHISAPKEVEAPTATIKQGLVVYVTPSTATVVIKRSVDNMPEAKQLTNTLSGVPVTLPSGDYWVEMAADGYDPLDDQSALLVTVGTNLLALTNTLTRSTGSLAITPQPGGFIYTLSGEGTTKTGTTPATQSSLETGDYSLTLRRRHWAKNPQFTVSVAKGANNFTNLIPYGTVVRPGVIYGAGGTSNAVLSLDGRELNTNETTLILEPGPHSISAHYADWDEESTNFDVAEGATTHLEPFMFVEGIVSLKSTVDDTTLAVPGGKSLGTIGPDKAFEEKIRPGQRRTYLVSKSGYRLQAVPVTVEPGKTTNVLVTLVQITNAPVTPAAPELASVTILTTPTNLVASVTLDNTNQLKQLPPFVFTNLALTVHTIHIESPGYYESNDVITLTSGGLTNSYALVGKPGSLTIDSAPQGLAFTVAGPNQYSGSGQTPDSLDDVKPGTYTVVVKRTRFPDETNTVTIGFGAHETSVAKFPQGTLAIASLVPTADISVDGEKFGKAPLPPATLPPLALPPGPHTVTATDKTLGTTNYVVTLTDGQTNTLSASLPYGVIQIASEPPGASIIFDNQSSGATPTNFPFVKPGTIKLELNLLGYLPFRTNVDVAAVEGTNVTAQLIDCHLKPVPMSQLTIMSDPSGAEISGNGQVWGATPFSTNISPKSYQVQAHFDGFKDASTNILLVDGSRYFLKWSLEPSTPPTNGPQESPMFTSTCGMQMRQIAKDVYAGIYPVTEAEFHAVVDKTTSASRAPMRDATWSDATNFCALLTAIDIAHLRIDTNHYYALPTTNQWRSFVGDAAVTLDLPEDPAPVDETSMHNGFYGLLTGLAEWCQDAANTEAVVGTNGLFEAQTAAGAKGGFRCVLVGKTGP